jgi:hypothetical protein
MKWKKSARVSTEARDDALRIAEDEAEEREFTVVADQNGAQEKLGERRRRRRQSRRRYHRHVIYILFLFGCGLYITFTVFTMFIILIINIYGIMDISINLDYRKYGIG